MGQKEQTESGPRGHFIPAVTVDPAPVLPTEPREDDHTHTACHASEGRVLTNVQNVCDYDLCKHQREREGEDAQLSGLATRVGVTCWMAPFRLLYASTC